MQAIEGPKEGRVKKKKECADRMHPVSVSRIR